MVRVLGLGNVLLGDEGVGVHAIRWLQERNRLPAHCEAIDAGTGGLALLHWFEDASRILLIDATSVGEPGTITRLEPRFAREYPPSLAAHDIGLRDLLEVLELRGVAPRAVLYAVSVDPHQKLSLRLSAPVQAALPVLVEQVERELADTSAAPLT